MAQKPSIPKGTRDFSPAEMHKRNYIFIIIKDVYQLYGFQPLETPAMENLSVLTGKYGEEGDQLLFKILNSGNFLKKVNDFSAETATTLLPKIAEKGLRYDLTVPFARYVVQHQHEISFPFKRYQIQPVWRADRPQKGRYREFYQCDADVIGMNALFTEAELMKIIDEVFHKLKIKVKIKINSREILHGIAESICARDHFKTLTTAIDKLDKIGIENVMKEIADAGVSNESIEKLRPILEFKGTFYEKLAFLKNFLKNSKPGIEGIEEITTILDKAQLMDVKSQTELDLTLARGLDYYTGAIFEVTAIETEMGSICGGGRYDDLTGIFGLKNVSGVGISFGAERIYDVMEELNLFPTEIEQTIKVMLVNFGNKEEEECIRILRELRKNNITAEMYPQPDKMKKQMNFANANNIPRVILVGEEEFKSGTLTLKNMTSGEQTSMNLKEAIELLKE